MRGLYCTLKRHNIDKHTMKYVSYYNKCIPLYGKLITLNQTRHYYCKALHCTGLDHVNVLNESCNLQMNANVCT